MRNPFRLEDRRLALVAALPVFLLGAALGVELLLRARRATAPRPTRPGLDAQGGSAGGVFPARDEAWRSLEQLMQALGLDPANPLVRRFLEAFLGDAALRRFWESFRHSHDRDSFLAALRSSPAFSGLLTQFAARPGGAGLLQDLARQREFQLEDALPASGDGRSLSLVRPLRAGLRASRADGKAAGRAPRYAPVDEDAGERGAREEERPRLEPVPALDKGSSKGEADCSRTPRISELAPNLQGKERGDMMRVVSRLGSGKSAEEACAGAAMDQLCRNMANCCAQDPSCSRWLGRHGAAAAGSGGAKRSGAGGGGNAGGGGGSGGGNGGGPPPPVGGCTPISSVVLGCGAGGCSPKSVQVIMTCAEGGSASSCAPSPSCVAPPPPPPKKG